MAPKADNRFQMPAVINPPSRICVTIEVPDDATHWANFWGALDELAQGRSYFEGGPGSIKQVIQVWRDVLLKVQLDTCKPAPFGSQSMEVDLGSPLRIDCDCNVFITCCDGTEKQILTADQIKLLLATQPGAGTPQPKPGGGCQEYNGTIIGAQQWLLPSPVNTGDVLTLESTDGASNQSGGLSWQCPDGSTYFAGLCGTPAGTSSSNLDPTRPTGMLLWKINSVYYATTSPLTVPSGVADLPAVLVLNYNPTVAVNGTIAFVAKACNNQPVAWCRFLDFTLNNFGFLGQAPCTVPAGTWVPGSGWTTQDVNPTPGVNSREICISTNFAAATTVTDIDLFIDYTSGSGTAAGNQAQAVVVGSTAVIQNLFNVEPTGTGIHLTWHGSLASITAVTLAISTSIGTGLAFSGSARIRSLTMKGVGAVPTQGVPC